jgi:hypothetical protein
VPADTKNVVDEGHLSGPSTTLRSMAVAAAVRSFRVPDAADGRPITAPDPFPVAATA